MIKEKVCPYFSGNMGGGCIMKKVTNGDVGGEGSKIRDFRGDVTLDAPKQHLGEKRVKVLPMQVALCC